MTEFLNKKRAIFKITKVKKMKFSYKSFVKPIKENTDTNNNFENESDSENKNKEITRNSLISISKEVYKFIKQKHYTKGSDVTNHILNVLSSKKVKLNYKNIQRRVYDAINVMCAIGLINKEKGNITFISNDEKNINNDKINNVNLNKENFDNNQDTNIDFIKSNIKEKQNELVTNFCREYFYKKLIEMNQNQFKRSTTIDKLEFPFYIITLENGCNYKIKQNDDNSRVVIFSDKPYTILNPDNIIKRLIKKDFSKSNIEKLYKEKKGVDEIMDYLIENKLFDIYFSDTKSEQNSINNFNNNNKFFPKPKNFMFYNSNKYFDINSHFDTESILNNNLNNNNFNNNLYGLRKGSEDFLIPNLYNFNKVEENNFELIEDGTKYYSNNSFGYINKK